MIAALVLAASLPSPTALAVLTRVNDYRRSLGFTDMRLDGKLNKAAEGHIRYMKSTGLFSHEQEEGRPAFTGRTPTSRARREGYLGKMVLEDLGHGALEESLAVIFDGPYHRRPFLQPMAKDVGVANDGDHLVVMFEQQKGSDPLVYPLPGSTVAATWNGKDNPNPVRMHQGAKGPFGPAIQAYVQHVYDLRIERFELQAPDGRVIACYLNTRDNDAFYPDGAMLIPRAPLQSRTDYRVFFSASDGKGDTYDKVWVFTTR